MRIGHGYDAHRLVAGRALYIGGIEIPHEKGLLGHSDADVLLHALMDAILGAAALGDIGTHFPPSDMNYKGIRSTRLLKRVMELIGEKGYKICNVDMTVIAQKPKLSPYIESMRQCIAEHLQVGLDAVSVKATTTEGMGFTGREEGIAAVAVCLLDQK
ncbi:MAG: 2-C-methyl-D-erythritol 2,4-cyclodiphosphate synthase [Clostridia bacterium]|nr:2-C-methyl-D-erythritol 2,4-cyclodiphosphate synthase [Clostridia bacterium]